MDKTQLELKLSEHSEFMDWLDNWPNASKIKPRVYKLVAGSNRYLISILSERQCVAEDEATGLLFTFLTIEELCLFLGYDPDQENDYFENLRAFSDINKTCGVQIN